MVFQFCRLIFILTLVTDLWQVMVPDNYREFIDTLTNLVKNNRVPMSRIDDAVQRILRVKFVMGLFEDPIADLSLVNQLGSQVSFLVVSLTSFSSLFQLRKTCML